MPGQLQSSQSAREAENFLGDTQLDQLAQTVQQR